MSKTYSRKLGITLAGVLALIVSPAQATLIGYTGTIQTYTVATTGLYDLTVAGAQGGSATRGAVGGLGAVLEGQVFLTAGLTLQVVVAGQGVNGASDAGGGGGGGSFVFVLGNTQPLIVAGGGGGAFFEAASGLAAETGQSGSPSTSGGAGGLGGSGGVGSGAGGGGAGWLGNGTAGSGVVSGSGGSGPGTFAGGAGVSNGGMTFPNGGFGGGGGGGFLGGGGGGGYSGGGGGGTGGGGGSYFAPSFTLPTTSMVSQTGNGSVSINQVAVVPEAGTALFGVACLACLGVHALLRRRRALTTPTSETAIPCSELQQVS